VEQRCADFWPARVWQRANQRAEAVALSRCNVIKVKGTRDRHPIVGRQHDFRRQSADSARCWHNDQLVEVGGNICFVELALQARPDAAGIDMRASLSPR